jgi:outer membrane scaffolding protein for murein synthesis (MipA/OmpV family)
MRLTSSALLLAALAVASPAFAQATDQAVIPEPDADRDYLSIGLGAALVPDYEGSDDYRPIPGLIIRAKKGGLTVFSRGTYLYADLLNTGSKVDLDAGPIVGVRLNRTGKIKDDAVDALGDRNAAIEVGGFGGVTFKGLTNPYDSLSFRLDAVKDVANAHESWVLTPSVDFGTPLSLTTFVGASLSADFTSRRFARYYFGVDPAGALASGLPAYDPDGGFKSWQLGLLASQSLSGDLRRGFALFGTGSYKRLVGDYADSPLVANRGSRTQWFGAVGVGYTF